MSVPATWCNIAEMSTHVGRKNDDRVEKRDVDCSSLAAIVSRFGRGKGERVVDASGLSAFKGASPGLALAAEPLRRRIHSPSESFRVLARWDNAGTWHFSNASTANLVGTFNRNDHHD